jgi:ABC-type transporter MlaC component
MIMKEWLFSQFESFNLLMILVMISFVTALSKANTQKMLKEQSQELYAEFEELKDEVRGNTQKLK